MSERIEVDPVVLSCAVRYALGRHSYLPGLIIDEVRRCWPSLGSQRDVIRDDIERWLADSTPTGPLTESWAYVDRDCWRDLLAELVLGEEPR